MLGENRHICQSVRHRPVRRAGHPFIDQNDRSVRLVNPRYARLAIGQRGRPQNVPPEIECEHTVAGRLIQNGLRKHRTRENHIGSQGMLRIAQRIPERPQRTIPPLSRIQTDPMESCRGNQNRRVARDHLIPPVSMKLQFPRPQLLSRSQIDSLELLRPDFIVPQSDAGIAQIIQSVTVLGQQFAARRIETPVSEAVGLDQNVSAKPHGVLVCASPGIPNVLRPANFPRTHIPPDQFAERLDILAHRRQLAQLTDRPIALGTGVETGNRIPRSKTVPHGRKTLAGHGVAAGDDRIDAHAQRARVPSRHGRA